MNTSKDVLICPITLTLFRDPVLAQDGHTYERVAIESWIKRTGTSPITNQPLESEHLYPNRAIQEVVKHFDKHLKKKDYQFTLGTDVMYREHQPFLTNNGHSWFRAEWMPYNEVRPEIVLLETRGIRSTMAPSIYVNLSEHPHIVRTFGLVRGSDQGNSLVLLQGIAPECNLLELIRREKPAQLDNKVLSEIFKQISDAMSYLASHEIRFRDLKCDNVLVFRFDRADSNRILVKVINYDLNRHGQIFAPADAPSGTTRVRYSAPELLVDARPEHATEKSDVYAFGVLMWEVLSGGEQPWSNIADDKEVIQRVRSGMKLVRPSNCGAQFWSIMQKVWSSDPTQRPTFQQLKNIFEESSGKHSTESTAISSVPPTESSKDFTIITEYKIASHSRTNTSTCVVIKSGT